MFMANLMLSKVSGIQLTFALSGSDSSPGPAKVDDVQEVEAPL